MSSLLIFVPNNWLIFSGSNFILFIFCGVGYLSIFPSIASPAPNSSTSCTALFTALSAFSGDNPFSNLDELSVLNPTFFAVFLTAPP